MATKPDPIDPMADRVLSLLAGKAEAAEIVLGGYFALQHYAPYRATHDIDAWWKSRADPITERAIREAMNRVANEAGFQVRERRFGETISFELEGAGRTRFSFQIAVRSVALEPPVPSAWPPVLLETLADNVASKMNALVDRGAPRDFTDIEHVVAVNLVRVPRCWELWRAKNPGEDLDAGKRKVLFHLAAIEGRRPLESIPDPTERERARRVREWFRCVFACP